MEEAKKVLCQQIIIEYKNTQQLDLSMRRRVHSGSIKVLGLHVDSNFSWSAHIDETEKKLSAAIFRIRIIKDVATHDAARLTFFANFYGTAFYGLPFWGMVAEADFIFKLQKSL